MKSVDIINRYNTTFGLTLQVRSEEILKVGDTVIGNDGAEYIVKKIMMPSRQSDIIKFV